MLLEVKDLKVAYDGREVVKGVSFAVGKGEIFGIVGESGSGKSTIARSIVGLTAKSGGEININASSVQMVFQDAVGSLNPRMTAGQTLQEALAHAVKRSPGAGGKPGDVHRLLEIVGLSPAVLGQYPREMSGGQCQRVSIARALVCGPEVLVADEPVSALDVSVQARVLNLLRDLRNNLDLSIILIAHDLAVVKNVCDRIAVMERGLIVEEGRPEEIFASPRTAYTARLLTAVPQI